MNFSRTGGAAELTAVDVHRVLDDTLQLLEPQLRRSQIRIIRDYGDELPQVHANAVKLQQVFTNLILNARDSIANGDGRITLATRNGEEGLLTVEVADNGVGIAPEDVAKIYDPFFTTKGGGPGHRFRIGRHLRHRAGTRRPYQRLQYARDWHYISHYASHPRSRARLAAAL